MPHVKVLLYFNPRCADFVLVCHRQMAADAKQPYKSPTLADMKDVKPVHIPSNKDLPPSNTNSRGVPYRRADRKYPTGNKAQSKLRFGQPPLRKRTGSDSGSAAAPSSSAAAAAEPTKKSKPNKLRVINGVFCRFVIIPDEAFRARIGANDPNTLVKILTRNQFGDEDYWVGRLLRDLPNDFVSDCIELWHMPVVDITLTGEDLVTLLDLSRVARERGVFNDGVYGVRVSRCRGNAIQEVLRGPPCKDCHLLGTATASVSYGKLYITFDHCVRLVRRVVEIVRVLKDAARIKTEDMHNGNLVIQPTTDEIKAGVLTESLPVMVDFGSCKENPDEKECVDSIRHWLSGCIHIGRKLLDHEYPWLAAACNEDKDKCTRYITGVLKCASLSDMLSFKLE